MCDPLLDVDDRVSGQANECLDLLIIPQRVRMKEISIESGYLDSIKGQEVKINKRIRSPRACAFESILFAKCANAWILRIQWARASSLGFDVVSSAKDKRKTQICQVIDIKKSLEFVEKPKRWLLSSIEYSRTRGVAIDALMH